MLKYKGCKRFHKDKFPGCLFYDTPGGIKQWASVTKREQKQKGNDIKKGTNKTRTKTGKTVKLFGKVVCKRKYI